MIVTGSPLWASMLLAALAASPAAPPSTAGEQIERLAQQGTGLSPRVQQRRLVEAYRQRFPAALPSEDLTAPAQRFEAATTTAFYSHDEQVALEAAELFEHLPDEARQAAHSGEQVVELLRRTRQFDAAATFARRHLPATVALRVRDARSDGSDEHAVLRAEDDGLVIEQLAPAYVENGIVVIIHPLCGFSPAATAAIEADAALSAGLADALWLMPQDGRLDPALMTRCNALHPQQRVRAAYRRTGWNAVDRWATPTFHFFAHGRRVAKVEGWPRDGSRRQALLNALQQWQDAQGDQAQPSSAPRCPQGEGACSAESRPAASAFHARSSGKGS